MTNIEANKALVRKATTELFINKDHTALQRWWDPSYVQHNPAVPDGVVVLGEIVKGLPANFKYTMGMMIAEGDFVCVHGHYVGWGPKPMVGIDIYKIKNGKIAEHWDVLQEEVLASETKSGRPMFAAP